MNMNDFTMTLEEMLAVYAPDVSIEELMEEDDRG
jgi:hypothetical protein